MSLPSSKSTFSRVSLTLATRIAAVGGSVLGGIVIARYMGPESVGVYAVLLLLVNSMVQILGAGLAAANIYYGSREPLSVGSIAANSLAFSAAVGAAAAAGIYFLLILTPALAPNIPSSLLLISLATLPFQVWTLLALNTFLALGNFRRFNLLDFFSQSYIPINALLVLVVFGAGLDILVIANAACAAGVALVVAIILKREIRSAAPASVNGISWPGFKRMMAYGLRINVMNAALVLVLRSDVLFVNNLRGTAEAGVYSVAAQCSLLLIMFPNVVGTVIFPSVSAMRSNSADFTASIIRHAASAQMVFCLAAIPMAWTLPYIYGAEFTASSFQFLLLIPGAFAIGLQMMLSQHLAGTGAVSPLPYFWLATLAVNILVNLLLIPGLGGAGAALASSVSYIMIFLLTLMHFRRHVNEPVSGLLFLRPAETRAILSRFGW